MEYKKIGETYYVRMDRGDEIISNLLKICRKESILSAVFSGIGGCSNAELQVFIPESGNFETEKIDYSWLIQQSTGVINMTNILYKDRFNGNTQLNWDYEDYKLIESTNKLFPNTMNIALTNPKKEVKLEIKLNYIKHETGWEELTKVSNKHREVTIDEILQRFMAL